jgi:putative cardiolipin synthase
MRKFSNSVTQFVLVAIVASVAGCASVDFDYPKTESSALQGTEDTYLGRKVADDVAAHPGQSGFYPIWESVDSLALRLLLAERAEKSIDAQYFLIYDDVVGNAFANALLKAANRGVRVRFLLDDILSKGLDPGLATLDSHPNIEVRIFNPLAYRSARVMNVGQFDRMTRRMHNKSFTVDNQVTLVGGRNIAGEYFGARADEDFLDLDVLGIGPIVPEVSDMFDLYWNHRAALPILALADAPDDAADRLVGLQAKIDEFLKSPEMQQYSEVVNTTVLKYVETDSDLFHWSDYDLVYDSPNKSSAATVDDSEFIFDKMKASIGQAQTELFVLTPYFVLTKDEIDGFGEIRARGVDVTVVTNSLASNNHTAVHANYAPMRKRLLEMGVNLYELRAYPDMPVDKKPSGDSGMSTLHAKTFAVDRRSFFIGSFNWNQRSANRDTESGVIIHSPELSTQFVNEVSAALPEVSFKLSLDNSNDIVWTIYEDGKAVTTTKEPQTGAWKRFTSWLLRIVPRSQL